MLSLNREKESIAIAGKVEKWDDDKHGAEFRFLIQTSGEDLAVTFISIFYFSK